VVVAIPAAYNDDALVLLTPTIAVIELMVAVQVLDGSIRPSLCQIVCSVVVPKHNPVQLSFQIVRNRFVMKNFRNLSVQ